MNMRNLHTTAILWLDLSIINCNDELLKFKQPFINNHGFRQNIKS